MSVVDRLAKQLYMKDEYGNVFQRTDVKISEADAELAKEKLGIRTDVHKTCVNCQIRQIQKYGSFNVKCEFIAKTLPPGSEQIIEATVAKGNTDYETAVKLLRANVDPVTWAELMFGFNDSTEDFRLRPWQKEWIRCTAHKYAVRAGRRMGKSFGMAVKMLHFAFTNKIKAGVDPVTGEQLFRGSRIMIITPFQAQVTNLFDEMEKLLKKSEHLVGSVLTGTGGRCYVQSPFAKLEVQNEFGAVSRISGFVSGIGSSGNGSEGGSARGQSADFIYLDEMDMIPDGVMTSVIIPIIASYKGVRVIATSTPIGKKGSFYRWCKEEKIFKEDYLPSTLLPQWDEQKDFFRSETTQEVFEAEYFAKFMDGGYGVFKPSLVNEAMKDYSYEDSASQGINSPFWSRIAGIHNTSAVIKCLGIDWNETAGTEYVVTVYDPNSGKWWVAEAVNLPPSQFSGATWKAEVVRLNYKWKPDFIYADKGYGHTIIEDLLLFAQQLATKEGKTAEDIETCKLVNRLITFDFKKKISLRDPLSGKEISKEGKPYIVQNAIRLFEDKVLNFPYSDLSLVKQVGNYKVLKINVRTNEPVYGPDVAAIGDHRLDAFMLSLAGIVIERSVFSASAMPISEPRSIQGSFLTMKEDGEASKTEAISFLKKQNTGLSILNILGDRAKIEEESAPRRGRSFSEPSRAEQFFPGIQKQNPSDIEYPVSDVSSGQAVSRGERRSRSIR